ncbi:InlB B-repeat-containing protein [Lysinibacillus capsici]|uniref:InlB B-repeat-containing protein n=1 Tax=Lysinibacillus capsici TaxID=2115968 RepID=UPI0028BD3C13|nr:InlB B-repeat-containing protein [Lysinibacillus capsici]WNN75702.1 InlB B-repeat-containing protein [Lysinibacillus capsici]
MRIIQVGVMGVFLFLIFLSHGLTTHAAVERNFHYKENGDGSVTITLYSGSDTEVEIPDKLGSKPVTKIGIHAFSSKELEKITIPEGVIEIGMYAFATNELKSIVIPDSVIVIDSFAFLQNKLTDVKLSENLNIIGSFAFKENRLTEIEIPSNVKAIDGLPFLDNPISTIYGRSESLAEIYASVYGYSFVEVYKVTFETDGGSQINSQSVRNNKGVIKPEEPSKEGHTFVGWYKDEALTKPWDFESDVVKEDMTLYAKWAPKISYTVTFHVNDESNFPQIVENKHKILEPSKPSKLSHTFEGWYKDEDYTEKWNFETDVVVKDITLYAKWTLNIYKVVFETNGGTSISSQSITYDTAVIEPGSPSKEGYTFAGWYKDEALTEKWDFKTNLIKENTTLYAKWLVDTPRTYEVKFNTNAGSSIEAQFVTYDTILIEPIAPSKEGYTFAGWYKDAFHTTPWYFETDVVKENITLYAKWVMNEYEVIFETNGGNGIEKQLIQFNKKVIVPSNPNRKGYTFSGWYKEATFENEWQFETDVVTTNITLYAKWQTNGSSGGSGGSSGGRLDDDDDNNHNNGGSSGEGAINPTPTPEKPEPVPIEPQPEQPEKEIGFVDVPSDYWAWAAIEAVARRKIITGYPDGTFKPNEPVQRQHVALMLTRTMEFTPERQVIAFNDISETHPYFEAITKVQQAGIFNGDRGNFNPTANLTRAQMAAVLVEAFDLTSSEQITFNDVPSTHWAYNDIAILVANGIASGDKGNFKPNEPVTRAQFAAMLYKALQQFEK